MDGFNQKGFSQSLRAWSRIPRQASDESSSETLQAYREAFLQVARGPQGNQVGHSEPMMSPIWKTFEQMEQQQCDVTILCHHQITIK